MIAYDMETVGQRLQRARLTAPERGVASKLGRVTQSDVARAANVTRQAILKIEQEKTESTAARLRLIADFLKVNPAWLITGEGEMLSPKALLTTEEESFETGIQPGSKTDLVELVSAIHALTGQIVSNADQGRGIDRLLNMLDSTLNEYFSQRKK